MQKLSQILTSLFFALFASLVNVGTSPEKKQLMNSHLQIESSYQKIPDILHMDTNPKKKKDSFLKQGLHRGIASESTVEKEVLKKKQNKTNKTEESSTEYSTLDPNLYEADSVGSSPIMQIEVIQGKLDR